MVAIIIILGAECGISFRCCAVAYVRAHGTIEVDDEVACAAYCNDNNGCGGGDDVATFIDAIGAANIIHVVVVVAVVAIETVGVATAANANGVAVVDLVVGGGASATGVDDGFAIVMVMPLVVLVMAVLLII